MNLELNYNLKNYLLLNL